MKSPYKKPGMKKPADKKTSDRFTWKAGDVTITPPPKKKK